MAKMTDATKSRMTLTVTLPLPDDVAAEMLLSAGDDDLPGVTIRCPVCKGAQGVSPPDSQHITCDLCEGEGGLSLCATKTSIRRRSLGSPESTSGPVLVIFVRLDDIKVWADGPTVKEIVKESPARAMEAGSLKVLIICAACGGTGEEILADTPAGKHAPPCDLCAGEGAFVAHAHHWQLRHDPKGHDDD